MEKTKGQTNGRLKPSRAEGWEWTFKPLNSKNQRLSVAIVMATSCFPVERKGPSHPSVEVLSGVTVGWDRTKRCLKLASRWKSSPVKIMLLWRSPMWLSLQSAFFVKNFKKKGGEKKKKKLSKNFNASHQRMFLLLDGFPKVVSLMLSSSFKHFI